jgi:hypothetical protein
VKAAPTIKDVCQKCNNGPLSVLDNYGIKPVTRYFLPSGDLTQPSVRFEYESFDMFARWLLKILYNDARSSGVLVSEHAAFRRYILGTDGPPRNFSVFGGLLQPAVVPDELVSIAGGKRLQPRENSIYALTPELGGPLYREAVQFGRMINFYAFVFSVLVWRDGVELSLRREVQGHFAAQYHFTHLNPSRPFAVLRYCKIDTMQTLFDLYQGDYNKVRHIPVLSGV